MEDLRKQVGEVVTRVLDQIGLDLELTDDLSLIESGLLDSLTIVNVVQEIQDAFDIEIDFADVTIENFDSIELLAQFISERAAA